MTKIMYIVNGEKKGEKEGRGVKRGSSVRGGGGG